MPHGGNISRGRKINKKRPAAAGLEKNIARHEQIRVSKCGEGGIRTRDLFIMSEPLYH
jgi:hypothetical protein